jgi:RNA polymerase sigma-70 factor, ECF subfamily
MKVAMNAAAGEIGLGIERPQNVSGFEDLVALHQPRVLRTAYRLLGRMEDAQDAAQEAFLRLWKNRRRIEGDPQAWLYRVTVNICNDHYRRRTIRAEKAAEPARDTPDPALGAERVLAMEERKRLLMEGLQTLPERERAAVILRDIEGLPTRQVAEILDVAEVTVRSQISTARLKLAKYVRRNS